jgi:hypothetical protein
MKTKGRFECAIARKEELNNQLFTEKQMRGLSRVEKDFIRDNGYHVALNQNGDIFYLFISTNNLGKKQLYAISKKQSLCPNGHDINYSTLNYCCWLLFNAKKRTFSKFAYEFRFAIPNVKFIFA